MISLPLPSTNLVFSPYYLAVNGTLHSYKSQLWPPPLFLITTLNPSPSSVDFTFLSCLHSYTFLSFQGHRPHPNHCNLPINHCTYLLPNSSLSVLCPQTGCDPTILLFKAITMAFHRFQDEYKMPQPSLVWSSPGLPFQLPTASFSLLSPVLQLWSPIFSQKPLLS